ncbi:MAG: hypothetical protein BGO43_11115 [Gammaproteobacteria bacterium 39-13]|nr:flagellar FliJ family protein [Gammaproteobacteria bacterium]OJV86587.1 MAG: hypothetical protein BGO43_11115 [Gammaproteobacteria bacterium 39-13]
MADKLNHLNKLRFLLEKEEQKVAEKCAQYKSKIDAEYKKYHLLKDCLTDYRSKLVADQPNAIRSFQYRQYQEFFIQLEKAIHLQHDAIEKLKAIHFRFLKEYEAIKGKIKNLNKLIHKLLQQKAYRETRKENQQAIELFNQRRQSE